MQVLKIGQIFTIRWVASSFRTVKAVWNNYPALASHFKTASEDPSRIDTDRKKYLGLHKQLPNAGFVADLACMKDMLRELQALSLRLQQRDIDLVSASRRIQQCIDVLYATKECGGKSAEKAVERISQGLRAAVRLKGVSSIRLSSTILRSECQSQISFICSNPLTSAFGHRTATHLSFMEKKKYGPLRKHLANLPVKQCRSFATGSYKMMHQAKRCRSCP